MGGLLCHPHPDIALLAPLDIAESDVRHQDEDRAEGDLQVGEPPEVGHQLRLAVVHIAQHAGVVHGDADRLVLTVHLRDLLALIGQLLLRREKAIAQVFRIQRVVCRIGKDHREVHGADHLVEEEAQISRSRIFAGDILVRLCIQINDLSLACEQLVGDLVRIDQHTHHDRRCQDQQGDLEVGGSAFHG